MGEIREVIDWIEKKRAAHAAANRAISADQVAAIIDRLKRLVDQDRQLFVFGNGGSGANATHFATDLGKSASDKIGKRFRVLCLNDNASWMTALANDYEYTEVFRGQLVNYAKPGDMAIALSVSGNSPNAVRAMEWAKQNGVYTLALVGSQRGRLAELADMAIVIESSHFGCVEEAHMFILHLFCYAFIENPQWGR